MKLSELKQRVFEITKTESLQELKVERPELLDGLDLRKKASWEIISKRVLAAQPIEPETTTVITSEPIEPEPILDAYRGDTPTPVPSPFSRFRECFKAELQHNKRVFESLWSMTKNVIAIDLRQPVIIIQTAF